MPATIVYGWRYMGAGIKRKSSRDFDRAFFNTLVNSQSMLIRICHQQKMFPGDRDNYYRIQYGNRHSQHGLTRFSVWHAF